MINIKILPKLLMLLLLRNNVSKAGANRIELSRLSSEFLLISEKKTFFRVYVKLKF